MEWIPGENSPFLRQNIQTILEKLMQVLLIIEMTFVVNEVHNDAKRKCPGVVAHMQILLACAIVR